VEDCENRRARRRKVNSAKMGGMMMMKGVQLPSLYINIYICKLSES